MDEIIERTCKYFRVNREDILKRRRNFLPRKIVLYLARKYSSVGIEEIGRKFDISYPAVSKAQKRMAKEMEKMKQVIQAITLDM